MNVMNVKGCWKNRNTNLKKNSGYEHPEDVKPELFT